MAYSKQPAHITSDHCPARPVYTTLGDVRHGAGPCTAHEGESTTPNRPTLPSDNDDNGVYCARRFVVVVNFINVQNVAGSQITVDTTLRQNNSNARASQISMDPECHLSVHTSLPLMPLRSPSRLIRCRSDAGLSTIRCCVFVSLLLRG